MCCYTAVELIWGDGIEMVWGVAYRLSYGGGKTSVALGMALHFVNRNLNCRKHSNCSSVFFVVALRDLMLRINILLWYINDVLYHFIVVFHFC